MSQSELYELECKKCHKKSLVDTIPDEKDWKCDVCSGTGIKFIYHCGNCGFVGRGKYSSCPDCQKNKFKKMINDEHGLLSVKNDPEAKRLVSMGDVSNAIFSKKRRFLDEMKRKAQEKEEREKEILKNLVQINEKLGVQDA